jgi:hypothetical protein
MKMLLCALAGVAAATTAVAEPRQSEPTFDDLRQVSLDPDTNRCWIPFENGRIGMTAGAIPALMIETLRDSLEPYISPVPGRQIYARAGSDPFRALVTSAGAGKVVLVIDAAIIGEIMLEPISPIALYPALGRTPARTARLWTNSISRSQWASMLDCWDEVQHAD